MALTWDDAKRRVTGRGTVVAAGVLVVGTGLVPAGISWGAAAAAPQSVVVVTAAAGMERQAESIVKDDGGILGARLDLVNGFGARIPANDIPLLESSPAITSVTPDGPVAVESEGYEPGDPSSYSISDDLDVTGVTALQKSGATGQGIGVALVDTGVTPVTGLNTPGKVIDAIDISLDSQSAGLRHKDSFGHGTFIAGIIAAKDPGWTPGDTTRYAGVAPGAHIVNVKVGATNGAVDVVQVIAGLDWIAQHHADRGLNIRVVNLSLGYDDQKTMPSYFLSPLNLAAEELWHRGMVVVAATGNDGHSSDGHFLSPARDPYLIRVGAVDTHGSDSPRTGSIPGFDQTTPYDPTVVAPGVHVEGLRVPGSYIDRAHPGARVGGRLMRGSGTSEATAFISGVAADLISQRPSLTPDQVKSVIEKGAKDLPTAPDTLQGSGLVNAWVSSRVTDLDDATQSFHNATGRATLEAARGSDHIALHGVELKGERDIFGRPWSSSTMASQAARGTAWSGGRFNGTVWAGVGWTGGTWSTATWTGVTWSGRTWSGVTWSGEDWSGATWRGGTWSGVTWSTQDWSGVTWSTDTWATSSWA